MSISTAKNAISEKVQQGTENMTTAKIQGTFEWYIMQAINKFKRNDITFKDSRVGILIR